MARQVYDHLMQNKGKVVELWQLGARQNLTGILNALQDYYGLDVRPVKRGYGGGPATYVLAGEWFGKVYVDYIAEAQEKEAATAVPGGLGPSP